MSHTLQTTVREGNSKLSRVDCVNIHSAHKRENWMAKHLGIKATVMIGVGITVLAGAQIGEGLVVGAGAVGMGVPPPQLVCLICRSFQT